MTKSDRRRWVPTLPSRASLDGRAAARRAGGHNTGGHRIPSERDLARDSAGADERCRTAMEFIKPAARAPPGAGISSGPSRRLHQDTRFVVIHGGHAQQRTQSVEPTAGVRRAALRRRSHRPPRRRRRRTGLSIHPAAPCRRPAIAVETNWIPVDVVPDLDQTALEGSLFALLRPGPGMGSSPARRPARYSRGASRHRRRVALGIGEHSPCLRIRMHYRGSTRPPADGRGRLLAGSRNQLQITLSANAFPRPALPRATVHDMVNGRAGGGSPSAAMRYLGTPSTCSTESSPRS